MPRPARHAMPARPATPAFRAIPPLALVLSVLGAAPVPADQIPFRPDEAILACQARGMHAIEAEEGVAAKPAKRFVTERMPKHMWHVKGAFTARFDGETRAVDVECDVSSSGVEVFTMHLAPES
ncbi:MAG: hypothetical protein AAF074_01600 [Pseudomonadota bacterium]